LNQNWYYGVKCEKETCKDKDCRFAHNDMEVMYHPHIYKTKLCQNLAKPGGCPKKNYCSFAHGRHELRQPKFGPGATAVASLPGLQAPFNSSLFAAQQDFQTDSPPLANAALAQPNHLADSKQEGMAIAGDNEFRDATDQLKIRILDIVDQISTMHFERALVDPSKRTAESSRLTAALQDAQQTLQRQQQEMFALNARLELSSKYAQDLFEQATSYQTTITELKSQLDIQKGLNVSQMSLAALNKLEEDHGRVIQRIQAQKKLFKTQEGKTTSTCSVCTRSKVDTVLQPCGHQATCQNCNVETCPVCNVAVKSVLPVIERIATPPIPEFHAIQPPPQQQDAADKGEP